MQVFSSCLMLFFFNDTATTEIYTLSLHDALPIFERFREQEPLPELASDGDEALALRRGLDSLRDHNEAEGVETADRKSTRLNSSHSQISYAVFCLKKKD